MGDRGRGVIARWSDRLALAEEAPRISLGEGDTPCVESVTIGPALGLASLHFKLEGLNPTGSFKDRGMVVAVSAALHAGSRAIICASTGNTSASAAAYGGRFGLRTVVVVPQGRIASGKLLQARVHGATVISIQAGFDVALRIVRELCDRHPVTLVNSVNPNRIDGQKTAAFEIVDELGDAPDVLALPVGNAGNITAYWRGFREEHRDGRATRLPRMFGGQASGAAPLVLGRPVDDPQTVATAIRIGNPASWATAIEARDQSEGMIAAVDDEVILDAQRRLARLEGIFCEPASAAALAVLERAISEGAVAPGANAVCVLTGTGLKDPGAVEGALEPIIEIAPDAAALARAMGV
jgi:threonine synthase